MTRHDRDHTERPALVRDPGDLMNSGDSKPAPIYSGRQGVWLGIAVAVATVVELTIFTVVEMAVGYPEPRWVYALFWVAVAFALVGYVVAIALTVQGATRAKGLGMLVGQTIFLPLLVLFAYPFWYSLGSGG